MNRWIFMCLALAISDAHAGLELEVDASAALAVLEVIEDEGLEPVRGRQLQESVPVQETVNKMRSLGGEVSSELWARSLDQVARGETAESDPFLFAQIKAHREGIAATIASVQQNPRAFGERIAALIVPYTPLEEDLGLKLVLVAGSNSCGWTVSSGDFYVDLRCVRDDLAGLELLATHELYHVLQTAFVDNDSNGLDERHALLHGIVWALLVEGGAAYVADFTQLEGERGFYARFSLGEYHRNFERMDQSVALFEALVQYSASDPDADPDAVYRIGFTAIWDSPLYYVGYRMYQALESALGREALLELITRPPEQLVLAYSRLDADARPFSLSPLTQQAVRSLAEARVRQRSPRAAESPQ